MKATPIKGGATFAECPECCEKFDRKDITLQDVVGGDGYYYINDGYFFIADEMDNIVMAQCPGENCREFSDWEDWPEDVMCWKCSECGEQYESRYDADQCCA